MPQTIGIRFDTSGKTYCFRAEDMEIRKGDRVVVESELGISIGNVAKVGCGSDIPEDQLKPVLRKVTEADLLQEQENNKVRREAREYGLERINARGLPMKLLDTEVTLDRKRFIFYFVAETRIDFRELVKDLASKFRTRIELRQIGVRDAAKLVGGFGVCGREFCCKTFLKSFAPISIKMAKQQDLVLNACKLSGVCGRLMCCLAYEYDASFKGRRRKPRPELSDEALDAAGVEAAEEFTEVEAEPVLHDGDALINAGAGEDDSMEPWARQDGETLEQWKAREGVAATLAREAQEEKHRADKARQVRQTREEKEVVDRGQDKPSSDQDKPRRKRRKRKPRPQDAPSGAPKEQSQQKPDGQKAQGGQPQGDRPQAEKQQASGDKKRRRRPRGKRKSQGDSRGDSRPQGSQPSSGGQPGSSGSGE